MKLTKHHLCQMLSKMVGEQGYGADLNSSKSTDELLDGIFDCLQLSPCEFNRELVMREFFTMYMERYAVYNSMQIGMRSEFITRLYNNDLNCLVLVSDKVLRGGNGLFIAFCTENRRDATGMIESLKFGLDILIREFPVNKSGDTCYVAITPLRSILKY